MSSIQKPISSFNASLVNTKRNFVEEVNSLIGAGINGEVAP